VDAALTRTTDRCEQIFTTLDSSMLDLQLAQRCGSTGTVVLVARDVVHVANVGDSSAVLCRGAQALELTTTHRPDLPDEAARVQAAGGVVRKVLCPPLSRDSWGRSPSVGTSLARSTWSYTLALSLDRRTAQGKGGVLRVSRPDVKGGLAVSRGFGDAFLKSPLPLLTCEPSVSSTPLHPTDEFIIIASDGAPLTSRHSQRPVARVACSLPRPGAFAHTAAADVRDECAGLWDVLSARAAVKLVRKRNLPSAQAAAAALVKAALTRGSTDNITALVVYLGARPPN